MSISFHTLWWLYNRYCLPICLFVEAMFYIGVAFGFSINDSHFCDGYIPRKNLCLPLLLLKVKNMAWKLIKKTGLGMAELSRKNECSTSDKYHCSIHLSWWHIQTKEPLMTPLKTSLAIIKTSIKKEIFTFHAKMFPVSKCCWRYYLKKHCYSGEGYMTPDIISFPYKNKDHWHCVWDTRGLEFWNV